MSTSSAVQDASTVDAEHQVQVRLLKELRSAVAEGRETAELRERLADYCRAHFLSEELLMRLHAYPDYDDHVADHEQMLDAIEGLTEAVAIDALSAFLLRHIGQRDARFHGYLQRV